MRILSLSNCPLVASQGSGYVILRFCAGLRARGHEVDLFGPESFEWLPALKKARGYRVALGMLGLALARLQEKDYDLVEFYGAESWLAVTALSRWPGRRFVLTSHSNGLETYCSERLIRYLGADTLDGRTRRWFQPDLKMLVEQAFTRVDGIVTVSEVERQFAVERAYQLPERVITIDNCLPEEFLGLPVEPLRPLTVGYCGSWIARKGIHLLVPVFTRMLQEFPAATAVLVGVGADFRKEDYFEGSVAARVTVHPFVEDKQRLREIYRSLAILVVPSVYESFGLVTAEAMACGCAVVATRTGFAASLGPDEALVAEEPTADTIYEHISRIVRDEDLRVRLAYGGHRAVQRLHWAVAIQRLEEIYGAWVAERRTS